VEVCPTGIDIRNGTQLECINCTACIDACNTVMKKVKFDPNLIRYSSYNGIIKQEKLRFTPRIAGYSTVFLILLILVSTLLLMRKEIDTTILRTPGVMFQETADGYITNLYNLKIVNKTFEPKKIEIKLNTPEGRIRMVGGELSANSNSVLQSAFFVELPKDQLKFVRTPVEIDIFTDQELIDQISTSFIGPNLWQQPKK